VLNPAWRKLGSCLNRPRAKASLATPTQKGRGGFAAAVGLTGLEEVR